MKIKVSQLRRIIREEVERSGAATPAAIAATIADAAGVGTPADFTAAAEAVAAMIDGTYPSTAPPHRWPWRTSSTWPSTTPAA